MISASARDLTPMALWARRKRECHPVGQFVADACAGYRLGIEPLESGFGHRVINEGAALAAMRKDQV
ncbi:hypothetical protein [Mesorhizobium sp. KR9-304]|uniref:hypothetical protein n=1 Tax=Mesorhizobium sp. KR9-304 TaxID=3156614 RepID=UPI0032B426D6